MLLLSLVGVTFAQDDAPGLPALDAQAWHAPIDATRTLWADDSAAAPDGWMTARIAAGYMRDPLVYVWDDGEREALVGDAVHLNGIAAVSWKRVRVGLDMPLYLMARGDVGQGGGTGELALDVKGTLVDRERHGTGLAVSSRATFPTSGLDLPLAWRGPGGEVAAIVDHEAGDFLVAGNFGMRFVPGEELSNTAIDDPLFLRLGAGWSATEAWGLSGDLAASTSRNDFGRRASTPVEAMAGAWARPRDGAIVLRGGVAGGLTRGIGAPVARAVFSVGWEPPRVWDADADGIVDHDDGCPAHPEDPDAYEDADGCPEPTIVTIRVVDPSGAPIGAVETTVSGLGAPHEGGSELSIALAAGDYAVAASADDWLPFGAAFSVVEGPPVELVYTLQPEIKPGAVHLVVVDPAEKPIAATWRVDQGELFPIFGEVRAELNPASYSVYVKAEGYLSQLAFVDVLAAETTEMRVVLQPTRVLVTREKLDIRDKIYFETNQAVIKPESFGLLDEVAAILLDRPDVIGVRIEGHTDSRGSATYNLSLSDRRAAAVLDYLVAKGVDRARLTSAGFGEDRPIERANNAAAWDKNRRVEFFITEWSS